MGARGLKSRIFFQLWALFFLSMLFVDLLVIFILFDASFPSKTEFTVRNHLSAHDRFHFPEVSGSPVEDTVQPAPYSKTTSKGIYEDHRKVQTVSFLFILINSFFFATLGTYQLSRSYFKPLQRLAKRAESYKDESDSFFAVRKEDNEFSVLSTSLNKMLHRIADDKQVLKETIDSLEVANADLKKAQDDVIKAEKLATVGRLTSGLAHEIGNPIGIVLGYLDLLKNEELPSETRLDFIRRSEEEITRINELIRKLLDMSRKDSLDEKQISIHCLLEDLISVFRYQPFGADIIFETEFNASDDIIIGDPAQIRQLYLNLLLNSVDAVNTASSPKKKIVLRSNTLVGDRTLNLNPQRAYLNTIIVDNGPGFQSDHLDHVLDPFFTTKEPGKGTGLGLSVSYMIVEKFGGRMIPANDKKMGAAVQVLFPLQ